MARFGEKIADAATLAASVLIVAFIVAWAFTGPGAAPPDDETNGSVISVDGFGNVGIGTGSGSIASALGVRGNLAVGSAFSQFEAPDDGLAVEGLVGVGTALPQSALSIGGLNAALSIGSVFSDLVIPTGSVAVEGLLGIGVSTPRSALHVDGGISIGNVLQRGNPHTRIPIAGTDYLVELPSAFVGQFPRVIIGADGLPFLAYHDLGVLPPAGFCLAFPADPACNDQVLKVAHCLDSACSEAEVSVIDTATDSGRHMGLAIAPDGFPIIVYRVGANPPTSESSIWLAKCSNISCTESNIYLVKEVDGEELGSYISLAIGSDGLPVFAYHNDTADVEDLRVVHCNDMLCATIGETIVDNLPGDNGTDASLAIGIDGLPIIAYTEINLSLLRVVHCSNSACSASTRTQVDTAVVPPEPIPCITPGNPPGCEVQNVYMNSSSLAIGSDGLPIIVYRAVIDGVTEASELRALKCGTLLCDSGNATTTLDAIAPQKLGVSASLALGSDGFPIASYNNITTGELKFVRCARQDCSVATKYTIATPVQTQNLNFAMWIAVGIDGLPVIAYFDNDFVDNDLHVYKCGSVSCVPSWTRR